MTKLEAWLEEIKTYESGWLPRDESRVIKVIENFKETLELLADHMPRCECMDGKGLAKEALAIDPNDLGGPDEFKNKSQAV